MSEQEATTMSDEKRHAHKIPLREQSDSLRDGKVIGYQCPQCGTKSVTPVVRCACGGEPEKAEFANTGTVATYTIQRVASEQFINDVPFAWVVVQLDDDGPRVTGWVPYVSRESDLSIGDKVRLTTSYKPGFMFEKM